MKRSVILALCGVLAVAACNDQQEPNAGSQDQGADFASASSTVGINVVLKGRPTAAQLAELGKYGSVRKQFPQINGLTMAGKQSALSSIRGLRFVKAAAIDAFINIPPNTDLVNVPDFTGGFSTWDQDAINVTRTPLSSARD
ncbi:MAG: Subtilisin DY, partial [Gemmatimonadales bacterium]